MTARPKEAELKPMTSERLNELRELLAKATKVHPQASFHPKLMAGNSGLVVFAADVVGAEVAYFRYGADAGLYVAAVNALRDLLAAAAETEELRKHGARALSLLSGENMEYESVKAGAVALAALNAITALKARAEAAEKALAEEKASSERYVAHLFDVHFCNCDLAAETKETP